MNDATPPAFTDPADTWNRRYAPDAYLFGVEPNEWLRRQATRWSPGQRVLCVADGEGRNSVWLARQGLVVDAFDIATHGVEKARRLARAHGVVVNVAVADCDAYAWTHETHDGVAAIFIQFADPALRARLFERMVNSLKPGGLLVLQGYTPRQLEYRTGGPPQASHLYTESMLQQALDELDVLELQTYDAVITEGSGHHGLSALIGLVARKR